MDFSAIFHQIGTWSLRVAVLGALVGIAYLAFRGDADMPGARLVAAERPAPTSGATPCQPIGQMANGELVYSMDCENPPAAAPLLGPAASAN